MISAVIFDLFGTLIHLTRNTRPYLQLCDTVGATKRLRESLTVAAPTLEAFCDHLGASHPPDLAELQSELDADIAATAIFPDTLPTLHELKARGIRTALISNLASPYKQAFYDLVLSQYFDTTVFSCDVGLAKPDPEIYKVALRNLELPAAEVIMVGDSPRADVDGPSQCGIAGHLIKREPAAHGTACLSSLAETVDLFPSS